LKKTGLRALGKMEEKQVVMNKKGERLEKEKKQAIRSVRETR